MKSAESAVERVNSSRLAPQIYDAGCARRERNERPQTETHVLHLGRNALGNEVDTNQPAFPKGSSV